MRSLKEDINLLTTSLSIEKRLRREGLADIESGEKKLAVADKIRNSNTLYTIALYNQDFGSLYELIDFFDTESKCVDYLAKVRWWGTPQCPYCGEEGAYEINVTGRQKRWKCKECKKQYSVRVGTIFEDSKIPLRKWFIAIFLFTSHKKGISSHQLAKDIKITQTSAWHLLHRLRTTFKPRYAKSTPTNNDLILNYREDVEYVELDGVSYAIPTLTPVNN